jgi:DNA repair protein RadC
MKKITSPKTIGYVSDKNPLFQYEDNLFHIAEPVTLEQLCYAMSLLLDRHFKRDDVMTSPENTKHYLLSKLSGREQEIFCCLHLDNKHRVICFEELFFGSISSASVYPREVVKRCLHYNSAAVILVHNHPSGIPEPSQSDIHITKRLTQALELIDVRVLDHIIVGGAETVSLAERGLI